MKEAKTKDQQAQEYAEKWMPIPSLPDTNTEKK